jgi:M6 family metalloprotease-like protein
MRAPNPGTTFLLAAALILVLVSTPGVEGAYLRSEPQLLAQPDGSVVELLASGDEHYNWVHDAGGFVVVRDPVSHYLVYAVRVDGMLKPSSLVVGRSDPRAAGLERDIRPAAAFLRARWERFEEPSRISVASPRQLAPEYTSINNIVIFVRFADEGEFTDTLATYDTMYNSTVSGANSLRNYFKETSYSQLTVAASFFPTAVSGIVRSYKDANPRGYYKTYDSATNPNGYQGETEATRREHNLIINAVNAIASQVSGSLGLDNNGDGYVDSVTLITSGSPESWADMLWPHKWSLRGHGLPGSAAINGKTVDVYNMQMRNNVLRTDKGVGVLSHEFQHTLGLRDLYHYQDAYQHLAPVGTWDLMENDRNPPQHSTAILKYRAGWITTVPEITTSGTYSLKPLSTSSTNNCYKIKSPASSDEYFMVEYRKKGTVFDSMIPGSGLIVYRVIASLWGEGNRNGPPDEVYIYRPGGSINENGDLTMAHFSSAVGRTAIGEFTDPWAFLSDGRAGGLDISEVGAAGDTISFKVAIGGGGGGGGGTTTTILSDEFEGSFPGSWQVWTSSSAATTAWGRSTSLGNPGASAWCAGGGENPQPAGGDYVGNMNTWLYYGPFSLVGASDASAEFDVWYDTEAFEEASQEGDYFGYGISTDDDTYYGGTRLSGSSGGWKHVMLKFSDVKQVSAIGASQVWFGFWFRSNASVQGKGAFVDNVVIKKTTGTSTCTYELSSSSKSFSASGGTGSFSIDTGAECGWTASSNVSWITITSGSSGSGDGEVQYSVAANAGSARTNTITAAGQTFAITQSGGGGDFAYTYWLPVAINASGQLGSRWRSDLGLLNRGGGSANVELRLFSSGNVLTGNASLNAAAQGIYRDVVGQTLHGTGKGAMEVRSTQPLVVTSRTYNWASDKTFGQDYDGFAAGSGLSAGQSAYLAGLTEKDPYRTNIGITNTGSTSATVTVTLHDGAGSQLTSFNTTIDAGGFFQDQSFKNKAGRTDLETCYAKVTVVSGSGIIAHASVVDGRSNDPTTIMMQQ